MFIEILSIPLNLTSNLSKNNPFDTKFLSFHGLKVQNPRNVKGKIQNIGGSYRPTVMRYHKMDLAFVVRDQNYSLRQSFPKNEVGSEQLFTVLCELAGNDTTNFFLTIEFVRNILFSFVLEVKLHVTKHFSCNILFYSIPH